MKMPKIQIKQFTNQAIKFTQDNSPAILAGLGCIGVVGTAVVASKGTLKAHEILRDDQLNKSVELADGGVITEVYTHTRSEKIKLTWLCYLPAVGAGALSIAAIVMSHRISARRLAAMTAAFAVSQNTLEDYKDKVQELYGKTKKEKVDAAVGKDKLDKLDPNLVEQAGKGHQLFMDSYSGRLFYSTMEDVKAAQNHVNHEVLNHQYACLTDFYEWIGLSGTKLGNEVGWNSDKLMDIQFSTTMTDGGMSCIVVDFVVAPVRNFFRVKK